VAAIINPARWSQKPPGPVEIDWSSPLARGLSGAWVFSESGGVAYDLVTRRPAPLVGSAKWAATQHGNSVRITGTGDRLNAGTADYLAQGRWTAIIGFTNFSAAASGRGSRILIAKRDTWSVSDGRWQIGTDGDEWFVQPIGGANIFSAVDAPTNYQGTGRQHMHIHDDSAVKFWRNNVDKGGGGSSLTFSSDASAAVTIGNIATGGEHFAADFLYVYLFNDI